MRIVKSKFSLSFGCICGKNNMEEKSFLYIRLLLFLIDSYFFRDLVKRAVSYGEKIQIPSVFFQTIYIQNDLVKL